MEKKIILIFSLVFLPLIMFAQASLSINLAYDEADFEYKSGRYLEILPADKAYVLPETPGEPALPLMLVNVLLPENSEIDKITFVSEEDTIRTKVEVFPTQDILPISELGNSKFHKAGLSYQANSYPQEIIQSASMQRMNGYNYVSMLVSPFRYYPKNRELVLNTQMTVKIDYRSSQQFEARYDNADFAELIKSIVINPQDLRPLPASNLRNETIEYVVVTSAALASSFENLIEWKRAKGIWAEVVTLEHIYSTYSGTTSQLKIKNFLHDYYLNNGLVYVLLGGDNTIVPDQDTFASAGSYSDSSIPADLFYATFDNAFDWNADGDAVYGETSDDIDLAPELIISRLPIRTAQHVLDYSAKARAYEQNPPASDYAKKMLLAGDQLWRTWDGRSDADYRNERLWNDYVSPFWSGTKYRLYDTNTDFGGAGYAVSPQNFSAQINSGYGFTFIASHGSPTSISMESGGSFTPATASALTNTTGVFSTIACNTNRFDYSSDPCVSEAMIRNPIGGSVTYQGSSRYGWGINYTTDYHGSSYRYADELFQNIFDPALSSVNKFSFGMAATKAKLAYTANAAYDGQYRWLQFTLNSMGDPELTFFTENPVDISAIVPETIETGVNNFSVSSNAANASITIIGTDLYIKGETDGAGSFSTSFEITDQTEVMLTITSPNYRYYTSLVSVANAGIAPPAGNGPESTPVVTDVESDNGGWISLAFTLSQNDPFHTESVTPYLTSYELQRYTGSFWEHVTNITPEIATNLNDRELLIAVPVSAASYSYRMIAVCEADQGTTVSDWVDAGSATSADELPITIDMKVFLEGPYAGNGMMDYNLIDNDFLPLTSPDSSTNVTSFPVIDGKNIVDWVSVSIKELADGDVEQSCNAFLLNDGSIVNTTGEPSLPFFYTSDKDYYVVVKHRNHVEVISNNSYQISDDIQNPTIIDLTVAESLMGIGHKELSDGNLALLTGDASGNGQIQNSDKNDFWSEEVGYAGYLGADFNLNGQVQNSDKNDFWSENVGRGSTVPVEGGRGIDETQFVSSKKLVASASNLNFSFANSELVNGYLEFDIVLDSRNSNLDLGDTHLYLEYSNASFGNYIANSEDLNVEKGELFQEELIPAVPFYSEVKIENNDTNILSLEMEYNFASNPEYSVNFDSDEIVLYHISMRVEDDSADLYVKFADNNRLSLRNQQYSAGNENPVTYVNAGDPIEIMTVATRFDEESAAPAHYGLFENYPNPFNPVTQISFQVKSDENCELTIYNAKGQKVKELFSGNVKANSLKRVTWNGDDDGGHLVSSGVYFYKLRTGREVQIKKMLLQK